MKASRIRRSHIASLAGIWIGILSAALLGTIAGYFRWSHGFFPGVQGMAIGILVGTVAGYTANRGAEKWKFGYRTAAAFLLVVFFVIGELTGIGLAMSRFDPLQWFVETLNGDHIDLVIGPSRRSGFPFVVRPVDSYGWLFFNGLDLVLQWFLTLLMLGIKLNARTKKYAPVTRP